MTTRTRTTRKAPWAAVLTALLAVLALVFGALAFAGVANANVSTDKPDNPGSSAPGQVNPKPDKDEGDDGLVGGNPDVVCAGYMFKADNLSGFTYTIMSRTDGGITDWCLKAGQTRQYGNGGFAETVTVAASDKYEISHVAWNEGTPPPTPGSLCQLSTLTVVGFPDITATAYTDALASADYTTDLARCTPTNVEETVAPVTAAEAATVPETVAPVLPATVPVEAPEAVAVPAPATVAMPAAVPAGDGSTVPQVPVALLALLALATAAAVTSGLRMATTR
jgi:hypothetical protein